MTAELEALAKRFVFNSGMLQNTVKEFSAEDWQYTPEQGGNSAHWLIGHLAHYRRVLRRKLADEVAEEGWEERVKPRSEMVPLSELPNPDYLLNDFLQARKPLAELLSTASEDKGNEDWGREFPDGSTSIKGGAYFLHFHESYHIGQIGYIRRLRGKAGLR